MDPIIESKNISKKYNINHQRGGYISLREVLTNALKNPFRFLKKKVAGVFSTKEEFWALQDINFKVKKGEAVGIIGPNGAGKSTLLKVLSQITPPTTGEIKIRGRIASLLEVGTGFHPELTGRENIFLNGAILGMPKIEIVRKFDDIVNFSGIEKFLDTPLKHYSSGMQVRLAFAVAAHMEPDILLIDEVLAVGDAEFQKKCLAKMNEIIKKDGRTILFVSHNLQAINQLCHRAILLKNGEIVKDGPTQEVLSEYANMGNTGSDEHGNLTSSRIRPRVGEMDTDLSWTKIKVLNSRGEESNNILFHDPFEIIFSGEAKKDCPHTVISLGLRVKSKAENDYIFMKTQVADGFSDYIKKGVNEFRVKFDINILAPKIYEVAICADGPKVFDWIPLATELNILNLGVQSDVSWRVNHQSGDLDYPCTWSINQPLSKI